MSPLSHAKLHTAARWVQQSWVVPTLLGISSFAVLVPFFILDYDSHHEGYLLAGAIGSNEGLLAHSGFHAQYGPLVPWSQSIFLLLPFSELFNLKLWGVFVISATVSIIASFNRVMPEPLSHKPALFGVASLAWLFSADFFVLGNPLPWSSLLGSLLLVGSLWLLLKAILEEEVHRIGTAYYAFFSGFAAGLIVFSRINVGLALLLGCYFFILLDIKLRLVSLRIKKIFITGSIGSLALMSLILLILGSFSDYFLQSVIGPANWAIDASGKDEWNPLGGLTQIFIATLPALILIFVAAFIAPFLARRCDSLGGITKKTGKMLFLGLVGSLVFALYAGLPFLSQLLRSRNLDAFRAPLVDLILSSPNILHLFFLLGVSLLVPLIYRAIRDRAGSAMTNQHELTVGIIAIYSLAGLVQIVPTYDYRHFWWGLVLFPVLILVSLELIPNLKKRLVPILTAIGIVHFFAMGAGAFANLSFPRFQGPPDSILSGVNVKLDALKEFEASNLIQSGLKPGEKVLFLSWNGGDSVATGNFLSKNKNFVWWADPTRDISNEILRNDFVFTQEHALEQIGYATHSEFSRDFGLKVIICEGDKCLFSTP